VVERGKEVSASVDLFNRVYQQDFDACERCQPAMGSKIYANGGVLVPSEHHIEAFHSWVTEKIAGGSPYPSR
jgi:Rieske 2Fe-2S family protein